MRVLSHHETPHIPVYAGGSRRQSTWPGQREHDDRQGNRRQSCCRDGFQHVFTNCSHQRLLLLKLPKPVHFPHVVLLEEARSERVPYPALAAEVGRGQRPSHVEIATVFDAHVFLICAFVMVAQNSIYLTAEAVS